MTTVNKALQTALRRLRGADFTPLLLCWATAVFYCFFCLRLGKSIAGNSGYCTYTLQALAWRRGQVSLGQDYPWLELATYRGDWYVSFPPVPSVPLFFLTFLFNQNTPDHLLVKLYTLIGCLAVWRMLRKAGYDRISAAAFALLCSFASCLLALTMEGAVWYQAQTMAFGLTCVSLTCMFSGKVTVSLVCYALAVGCRPFNVLYGAPLFAFYIARCVREQRAFRHALLKALPGLILGLMIAAAYGWYNWVRFGNPLEFGHNYLPEFSWQGGVQFSLSHVADNLRSFLLRMPFSKDGDSWTINRFGFCFLLANPVFLLLLGWIAADAIRRRMDWQKLLLIGCFLLHLFLLLLHRTFGGYQFGARYTCDLLPYAAFYLALPGHARRMRWIEIPLLIFALCFAVYGAAEVGL